MKKTLSAILIGIAMFTGSASFAKGGGGGVPSPFGETANRRVELADGEMYTLQGKVIFDANDVPWFWVDLAKHPWLASQKRQQNPFYRLAGTRDQWREYNEKVIQLTCFARGYIGGGAYEIVLSQVAQ
jgi:hypothetical protein